MNRTLPLVTLCLALCVLTGCSLAPRYERPDMDIPDAWRALDTGNEPLSATWWERFGDPVLNAMVDEALRHNEDISEALARLDAAEARIGVGRAALLPRIDGGAEAASSGSSARSPNGSDFRYYTGMHRSSTTYKGSLQASWTLDLWGKYRNQYTALTNIMLQTRSGLAGTRLAVAAGVCQGYFTLLGLDMQLNTARRTLRTREQALGIYASRYKQGDITELDWLRAKSELEVARAQLHTVTQGVDAAEAALSVLLGRSPRDIMERVPERGSRIDKLPAPPMLPEGLPSAILLRRPDIRAAEFALLASNANIGAVRADFFPEISLTGTLGTLSSTVGMLFSGPAGIWSYGIGATMPLLDFGLNWYRTKEAEAQKAQAVAVYRKAVQDAFSDVRTSLTRQRESEAIVKSLKAQVNNMRRATNLARMQYDNGYTDYLTVLDAERQLFATELQYATALSDRLNAVVDVCQALGGGWSDAEITAATRDAGLGKSGTFGSIKPAQPSPDAATVPIN